MICDIIDTFQETGTKLAVQKKSDIHYFGRNFIFRHKTLTRFQLPRCVVA